MLAERLAVVAGFGHTVVSEECDGLVCGLVTESVDTELPALVYSRVVCTDAAEILLEDLLAQDELGGVGPVASLEVGYELLKGVVLRVDLLRWRADDGERGQHCEPRDTKRTWLPKGDGIFVPLFTTRPPPWSSFHLRK